MAEMIIFGPVRHNLHRWKRGAPLRFHLAGVRRLSAPKTGPSFQRERSVEEHVGPVANGITGAVGEGLGHLEARRAQLARRVRLKPVTGVRGL